MTGEAEEVRAPERARAASLLLIVARAGLVVLLVFAVVQLQREATFEVTTGSVSFQLEPAWPGGRLIMPLGPAGELSLRTHRTPVDVVMTYRLPAETAALGDASGLADDIPRLEGGARAAFVRFLLGLVPWIVLLGAAAGLLATPRWTRRRLVWGAAAGVLATVVLSGAVALATYATVDRTPSVQYRGLASQVPEVLPLLRALSTGGDQSDNLSRLQDYLDGLEAVATQLTIEPRRPERADVVRLLLASDIHDNVFGARAAARLAAGGGEPVDAVLLAGDVTDRGTAQEAQLFARVFGRARTPVFVVGGNHEDEPALRAFERAGYTVLNGETATVSGVTMLGASDPVAHTSRVDSDVSALEIASAGLAALWETERPPAQLLLVHDVRQAEATIAAAEENDRDLVVAYGNDHVAGVEQRGDVVLIDAGTAGASGYEAIGSASPAIVASEAPSGTRDAYTYQLIDFSRTAEPSLTGVTTLTFDRNGRTVVSYTPFGQ